MLRITSLGEREHATPGSREQGRQFGRWVCSCAMASITSTGRKLFFASAARRTGSELGVPGPLPAMTALQERLTGCVVILTMFSRGGECDVNVNSQVMSL